MLSRFCMRHASTDARHGHPEARAINKYETEPYRKVFSAFLRANKEHPAIVLLAKELDELIAEGASRAAVTPVPTRKPNSRDTGARWEQKLWHELIRLHRGAVSGRDVLVTVGALWMFSRAAQNVLPPMSVQLQFAVARAVLSLAERPGRQRYTTRTLKATTEFSAPVLRHFGQRLVTMTCGLMRSAEVAFDERASRLAERRRNLAAALNQPFA